MTCGWQLLRSQSMSGLVMIRNSFAFSSLRFMPAYRTATIWAQELFYAGLSTPRPPPRREPAQGGRGEDRPHPQLHLCS